MDDGDLRDAAAAADKAAREGRAWDSVMHLFIPSVISRMRGRLRGQWGWITEEQVGDAIQEAFVAMYLEIQRGGQIRKSVAWLATVAYRRAADEMRTTEPEQAYDPDDMPLGGVPDADCERTAAAFNHFERLVGRLTPEGVRRVMEIVVDGMKTGVSTLTNGMIAEILGEHPENVKKWRQRGFEKLGRLAREEGLVDDDFRLTDLILDDSEEETEQ